MLYKTLMAAAATAAFAASAPAFAQAHGHMGGPPAGAGMQSQGPMNASPMGTMNASPNSVLNRPMTTPPVTTTDSMSASTNSQATTNSQGPAHASTTGISHANQNSVLARGAVSSTTLPGLTSGLVVNNSSGTQVGTVTQVVTGTDGSIRTVVVTGTDGKTYRLAPSTLSISGSVVTTTSTTIGG